MNGVREILVRRLQIKASISMCITRSFIFTTERSVKYHNEKGNVRKSERQRNMRLGFLGSGRIAQAIVLGLITKKKLEPRQIFMSDASKECIKHLKERDPLFKDYDINFVDTNAELLKKTNTVFICVKPQDVKQLLTDIMPETRVDHLMISIAAGFKLKQIENSLHSEARVIRIMSNTAALIHESCSVFSRGRNATDDDAECVKELLESIGSCDGEVKEHLMDVVTGLSGSGPAYMFLVLDALAEGGVKMGLDRALALRLATRTMRASASMVLKEMRNNQTQEKHVMRMKEEVCSPGGTAVTGIAKLEEHGVRAAFIKCVEAATIRSSQLNDEHS